MSLSQPLALPGAARPERQTERDAVKPRKRLPPTQEQALCWLAAGGTFHNRYGSPLPQPAVGAPPILTRTLESLCRAGLAAWEPRPSPVGTATYQLCRITAAGHAALERSSE